MDVRRTDLSPAPERPPYRPPIGMPMATGDWWRGPVVSVVLHAVLIALLLAPALVAKRTLLDAAPGGGGPGPAGGGGGGSGGTGGRPVEERLQYIDIAPGAIPSMIPELPTPLPEPVIVPPPDPVVIPPPPPVPEPAVAEAKVEAPPVAAAISPPSIVPGTGGGSGNDGTAGMGPGSGGGVGTGIGTGRGSGVGPGTGGGDGGNYGATPTLLPLLPDAPDRIKPFTLIALFDVDEKGRVLKFEFNESKDRDYNRKVKAVLATIRFRPGTTPDGRAIRSTTSITFTAY